MQFAESTKLPMWSWNGTLSRHGLIYLEQVQFFATMPTQCLLIIPGLHWPFSFNLYPRENYILKIWSRCKIHGSWFHGPKSSNIWTPMGWIRAKIPGSLMNQAGWARVFLHLQLAFVGDLEQLKNGNNVVYSSWKFLVPAYIFLPIHGSYFKCKRMESNLVDLM